MLGFINNLASAIESVRNSEATPSTSFRVNNDVNMKRMHSLHIHFIGFAIVSEIKQRMNVINCHFSLLHVLQLIGTYHFALACKGLMKNFRTGKVHILDSAPQKYPKTTTFT